MTFDPCWNRDGWKARPMLREGGSDTTGLGLHGQLTVRAPHYDIAGNVSSGRRPQRRQRCSPTLFREPQ